MAKLMSEIVKGCSGGYGQVDSDGVQVSSDLSADGSKEMPDPVPLMPSVQFKPVPTIIEMIRSYIRNELSDAADAVEFETFEEADDFEIEDDPIDPLTPYERVFEPGAKEAAKRAAEAGGAPSGVPRAEDPTPAKPTSKPADGPAPSASAPAGDAGGSRSEGTSLTR